MLQMNAFLGIFLFNQEKPEEAQKIRITSETKTYFEKDK